MFLCLSLRKEVSPFLVSFLSSLSFRICNLNPANLPLLSISTRFLHLFSPAVL
jgi:hypothetical protein